METEKKKRGRKSLAEQAQDPTLSPEQIQALLDKKIYKFEKPRKVRGSGPYGEKITETLMAGGQELLCAIASNPNISFELFEKCLKDDEAGLIAIHNPVLPLFFFEPDLKTKILNIHKFFDNVCKVAALETILFTIAEKDYIYFYSFFDGIKSNDKLKNLTEEQQKIFFNAIIGYCQNKENRLNELNSAIQNFVICSSATHFRSKFPYLSLYLTQYHLEVVKQMELKILEDLTGPVKNT